MLPQNHTTKIFALFSSLTMLTLLSGCTEATLPEQEKAATTTKEIRKNQPPPVNITEVKDDKGRLAFEKPKQQALVKQEHENVFVSGEVVGAAPPSPMPTSPRLKKESEADTAYLNSAAVPAAIMIISDQTSYPVAQMNTESYTPIDENRFINTTNDPLSTFSIDVDTASYANIRRLINDGSLPPVGAVRIEEMINYFSYNYPQPDNSPVALSAELGPCPWNGEHKLVKIGLQAKEIATADIPPSNLVFLIDVSGSMDEPNKLPLLKQSMKMLVDQLGSQDRVTIVVYAGSDRIVLPPTSGDQKEEIRAAINTLTSGGSTHGSSGIRTAYRLAEQVFMPKGNNRVILASDGDFNVGVTDRGELQKLITEKSTSGVFLTVLGFGMGNYHDDTMEILADSGNGNYAYIDSLLEAKKVLIKERASTLFTLASDVKIQIEFNPARVGAYRLIGYENRMLADEDFKDDTKDAGEIGRGHSVTALYEIVPAGAADIPQVDGLKYRKVQASDQAGEEIMTVKLRYKPSGQTTSVMTDLAVQDTAPTLARTSDDFRFAAAVAGFGMLLKDSKYLSDLDYPKLLEFAKSSRGKDDEGYRAEFIRLVEMAQLLQR